MAGSCLFMSFGHYKRWGKWILWGGIPSSRGDTDLLIFYNHNTLWGC